MAIFEMEINQFYLQNWGLRNPTRKTRDVESVNQNIRVICLVQGQNGGGTSLASCRNQTTGTTLIFPNTIILMNREGEGLKQA